ncbi:MAG: hypothetical protein PHS44_02860 [Candidatus Dojkabacteria bacterium]|jgi:hypothetical protein|nr:hypothetical protein [Candidatus Dojkabacteria bacterium]
MNIGFSTGSFHKITANKNSNKVLQYLLKLGCNTVELSSLDISEVQNIQNIDIQLLEKFKYRFLHAPALDFKYDQGKETYRILDKLLELQQKYKFDSIGLHPDRVTDWSVFGDYTHLPLAIENMNSRKNTGKTVEDINILITKYGFKFLFDIQHCFSCDPKGDLADQFYAHLGNDIVEIHISGYKGDNYKHTLSHKNNQENILAKIRDMKLPIVIESPAPSLSEIEKELSYIREFLSKHLHADL